MEIRLFVSHSPVLCMAQTEIRCNITHYVFHPRKSGANKSPKSPSSLADQNMRRLKARSAISFLHQKLKTQYENASTLWSRVATFWPYWCWHSYLASVDAAHGVPGYSDLLLSKSRSSWLKDAIRGDSTRPKKRHFLVLASLSVIKERFSHPDISWAPRELGE